MQSLTFTRVQKQNTNDKKPQIHEKFNIPAAYHQVACQLATELSIANNIDNHEAHRRQAYARQILDLFAQELLQLKGYSEDLMVGFRSKVLTPLLVRQLHGIHDAYTPFVRQAVQGGETKEMTIEAATRFYLQRDPTDPIYIPTYRRNLLFTPIPRWFLGYTMKIITTKDKAKVQWNYYNQFIDDHDLLIPMLQDLEHQGLDGNNVPLLMQAEVDMIMRESLGLYFKAELVIYIWFTAPSTLVLISQHIGFIPCRDVQVGIRVIKQWNPSPIFSLPWNTFPCSITTTTYPLIYKYDQTPATMSKRCRHPLGDSARLGHHNPPLNIVGDSCCQA